MEASVNVVKVMDLKPGMWSWDTVYRDNVNSKHVERNREVSERIRDRHCPSPAPSCVHIAA